MGGSVGGSVGSIGLTVGAGVFKNFKSKGGEQSGTSTSYDSSSGEYCLLYKIKGEDVVNLENEKRPRGSPRLSSRRTANGHATFAPSRRQSQDEVRHVQRE